MATRAFFTDRRMVGFATDRRRLLVFGLVLCPLLLLLFLLVVSGCGDTIIQQVTSSTDMAATSSTSSSSTSSTEPVFVQEEGEIFLEAAGTAGPESFAGETFVPVGPTSTLSIPTSTTTLAPLTTTQAAGTVQVASYTGDTPALYGGSKSKALADKEGQLRFLEANPDKAAAFCAALNSDPTLRWSGGTQVQPSQLRDYFAELTPMMLTRDTRVTNYGYRDGRPTPRQSVLQAGQMVLVDRYGVPRVRCECGNPLTPPQPVRTTPRYTGPRWPGFDATVVIVIQQTTVIIEDFVLIDIYTGGTFVRPAGTDGAQDAAHEATVWELTVEMTRYDTSPKRVQTIQWKAEITANPDGTLSGAGEGIWHCDGTTWEGTPDNKTGTWVGDASLTISISGTVETTELGRTLKIKPVLADYSVSNLVWNSSTDKGLLNAWFETNLPDLLNGFTELDFPAVTEGPVMASVAAGNYTGSATLTPLR